MESSQLIESLGLCMVLAAALVAVVRWVKMPSIVAYLLAGLVVSLVSGIDGHDALHGDVELIGELGIVLLMFLVGLELPIARIRQVGGVALAAGLGQVVFTAIGGLALCWLLGFSMMESIFLATALTFSSTVVVVKLLDQKGELDSLHGRIAVGIFLVQDLVVIVVLTFLAGLESQGSIDAASIGIGVVKALAAVALLLGGYLLAARWMLPAPFAWAGRRPRALLLGSLAWCLLAVLVAKALALSPEIGAFLAGLSLAQQGAAGELRRRAHPLMNFFVAVFFVALGARMELAEAASLWQESLALSLFVVVGNPFIFMLIIARFGYSERTTFFTSVTVAQISELSFVFAAVGVRAGLIGPPVLAVVAVVGLVTIAASAYLILYSGPLYRRLAPTGILRICRATAADEPEPEPTLDRHVIVAGMNALGREIAALLHARGESVLAIDADDRRLEGLPCRTRVGDIEYRGTLIDAGLPRAKLAVATLRDEAASRIFALRCRQWGVPVVLHGFDREARPGLCAASPDFLIDSKAEGGHELARALERAGVLSR